MPDQQITIFDEAALAQLIENHRKLERIVVDLQRQLDERTRQDRTILQPVIGKTAGEAGTATGSYKVTLQRAGRHNTEQDQQVVSAKPWGSDAKATTAALLLANPFGQWYSWLPCPRLCKTMSDTTYPSSSANTFEFVYVLLHFTKTQGTQTPTLTDQSATAQGVGQTADAAFVPEGTYCLAVEQPNSCTILLPLECG